MPDPTCGPRLSAVLESCWKYARDAMIVADCETGFITELNPAAEQITGFHRAELIGKHQRELHPEGERDSAQIAFQNAVSDHGVFAGLHLIRKDGSAVPVEITSLYACDADGRDMVIGLFRDISAAVEREQRLALKRWALKAYARAASALVRARTSANLVQEICQAITQESIFVLAWVGTAEEGPQKPVGVAGAAGTALHYLEELEVSWDETNAWGQGPAGLALRTGIVQIIDDSEHDTGFKPWCERARPAHIRSLLAAPFLLGDNRRGVLMVYSSESHAFGPVVTEAFTHLAEEIGIGLNALAQAERLEAERLEREKEQAEAFVGMVGAITTAMEMRDPYTAGHQRRVARLAAAIAQQMNWPEEQIEALKVASLVHDVGKISVPAEILIKPNRLSPPEWSLLQGHAERGFEILKDVPFRWPIAEVVYQHHERLDGSGYPRGLKDDAIGAGARVLAVADIVESMATERPYRKARGVDMALEEIERQAGSKLDAEAVRICIALFREQGYSFAEQ